MIYLVGWMWDTSCRLLGFKSNRVASTLHTHHHRENFILALAQMNLWLLDPFNAPVTQSLNRSIGHASAANQIRFAGRENELTGLCSELSSYDITGTRLEVVTKFLFPSRWASRFLFCISFCFCLPVRQYLICDIRPCCRSWLESFTFLFLSFVFQSVLPDS